MIVSDSNGQINTQSREKTEENINCLDEYAQDGRFTDESMLDGSVNVWFGVQDEASIQMGRGSLIYGLYRIEELQCEANKGQVMISGQTFRYRGSWRTWQISAMLLCRTMSRCSSVR